MRTQRAWVGIAAVIVLAIGVAVGLWTSLSASAPSLIYFVRHAERADGGAAAQPPGMSKAPADPSLSEEGAARAQRLATMLADAGVKAVFVTEFKRTQETGRPLASRLGLEMETVTAKDYASLVSKAKSSHAREVVLIVGHSNTIPDAIKAFGGPDVKIPDTDYTGIYVLAPATGTLTLIRY